MCKSKPKATQADDTAASKRHVDDVCIEEISALVLHVLHQTGSAPRLNVARSVCRLLGMASVNATAITRVALAIERLQKASKLLEVGGRIRTHL
jgi:hypothetical protein